MSGLVPEAFGHDPSATASFAALPDIDITPRTGGPINAVVIGGGTGAPVSIRTLLSMGLSVSAVVAMADDGGSTGILRDRAGATTPGDVRKCITAMAGSADDPLTKAFKIRFGFAENHSLGNLMLSALEVSSGSFPEAIRICEELLHARGHVYPSTLDRVTLVAKTSDGRTLEGQAVACHSRNALARVALRSDAEIVAYQPAIDAILAADLIVLGPGSLFTSIIPNLLVPGVADAVRASKAKVVFVCSLADMQGETRGMRAIGHYEALTSHGMDGVVDVMLVHDGSQPLNRIDPRVRPVDVSDADIHAIEQAGTKVVCTDLLQVERPTWHDPAKLQRAFAHVLMDAGYPAPRAAKR